VTGVLAVLPRSSDREAWTPDEAAAIEAAGLVFTHAYGEHKGTKLLAPRPVVARFLHTCERTGLDPLARQIYCIGRFGSDGLEWSIQTGIDGFRVVAERSKLYAGQDDPEWLTESGEWVPAFVKGKHGDHPLAARVRVYRHDWSRPMTGIATWDEYAQTTRKGDLTAMWKQRGPGQLAKCAEALALRKAFPQDLSGLYTDDEMRGAVDVVDAADADQADVPVRHRSRVAQLAAASAPAPAQDATVVVEVPEGADGGEPASDGRTAPDEAEPVSLFPCSRCGESVVEDEGSICEPCEVAIEAEAAAAGVSE